MNWAQRLKRVFSIDIETCSACGGAVKVIACIEDPAVIEKILTHLDEKGASEIASRLPPSRTTAGELVRLIPTTPCNTSGCDTERRGGGGGCPDR